MDINELKRIKENLKNPPRDIKVNKYSDKIIVKIYVNNSISITISLFIAFMFSCFFSIVLVEHNVLSPFIKKELGLNFNDIFSTFLWLLLPILSVCLLYNSFYSAFGKIELVFGMENYIFQGFLKIGIKKNIDWKNIINVYQNHYYYEDSGRGTITGKILVVDYIKIKIDKNKNIKLSLRFLNDIKIIYVLSIIKYFKYKGNYNFDNIINNSEYPNGT